MKRRFQRTNRTFQTTRRAFLAPNDLPTVGHNDAKHFDRAEVVNLAVNRAELDTIAAALVAANVPETLSLLRRFQCR